MMLSYGIIHERQITQHLLFVFILGLPAIVVDFPAQAVLRARQGIAKIVLPGLARIDGPRRSLGHTGTNPRVTLTLSFDKDSTSDMDLRILISILRDEPLLQECLFGSRKLFGDSAAILMDINDTSVAQKYFNLTDEMIL